jgi:hypothetical protein
VNRRLAAVGGFIVLGLSPSFVDWQETPSKRPQMVAFYLVGILLIWYGLWST